MTGQVTATYFSCLCEQLDDTRMGHGHHALPVDFNDAVSNADSTTLRCAPTQQATNLRGTALRTHSLGCVLVHTPHPTWGGSHPHDAILHTEAQLLAHVGPADDGRGDRWAVDDTQCHG